MANVYDKSTGAKLGSWVSNEANDASNRALVTHYVYRNRKGKLFLARADRSEVR